MHAAAVHLSVKLPLIMRRPTQLRDGCACRWARWAIAWAPKPLQKMPNWGCILRVRLLS